ncbi:hypothetical protein GCM10023155_34620 [Bremerella cremea]
MFQAERMTKFVHHHVNQVAGGSTKAVTHFPVLRDIEHDIASDFDRIHIVYEIGLGKRPTRAVDVLEQDVDRIEREGFDPT